MNEEKEFRFLQLLFENEKERDQYYGMELKKEAPDYLDFDKIVYRNKGIHPTGKRHLGRKEKLPTI